MRFTAKEDIDAPAAYVFAAFSDFDGFEARAKAHGAVVTRDGDQDISALKWEASFHFRGRAREVDLSLIEYTPPECLKFEAISRSLTANFNVIVTQLSQTRTRVFLELELKPQALQARVFVQSLKLAKNRLTKRFRLRVADFSKNVEQCWEREQEI
jgi:uncharacterized protein YndB with AHSA1/START domain